MSIKNAFTLIIIFCLPIVASAEPQLAVQLDRSALYEGESLLYTLILTDTNPTAHVVTPDTSVWSDFDVQLLGTQTGQRGGGFFSMTINGRTVRDDRTAATHFMQFSYRLTPKRTGTQSIPLPKVNVDGKTLLPQTFSVDEGNRQISTDYSVAVQVLAPEDQDIVFMTIETNRSRLYPMQPLEITLIMQIKGLPEPHSQRDPLSTMRQLPTLQIPWSEAVPKGFQTIPKPDNQASRQIQRFDAQGNEITYWEYHFTRTLIPKEFGNYSFGPATIQGVFPVADANASNGIAGRRMYVLAKPVSVAVVDVPQENRPADYTGAFGSFHWEASLTPNQSRVGDPMTLTLRLFGEGSMANVRPIDLSVNPDVAANFRVHMPPTEDVNEQACRFTYTIRPLNSGEISFPSIPISVFDVNTERFVTLESSPIPLTIGDSESVQSATLFGSVPGDSGAVQLAAGGLFANKTVISEVFPPISFLRWVVVVSVLAGGYVVLTLGVLLLRYQWTTPRQQRRRGALHRAKTRLATISRILREKGDAVNLAEMSSELQGSVFGYIADKMEGTEQGMTTSDACQKLLANRVPESLVDAIRKVLESLDAVKYGGLDTRSLNELTHTTALLLQQLEG